MEGQRLLVTGATGLVGGAVARRYRERGWQVRALVRDLTRAQTLGDIGVELTTGELGPNAELAAACDGVTHVVHCAAKVGDWGPVDDYRDVNVGGTKRLIEQLTSRGHLERFVHISSLGVYEARDHHGTDESEPANVSGIDGYTVTKAESEAVVVKMAESEGLPAIILRPGFIYGPGDRTVIPRIIERLRSGKFAFLGSGDQLLNNVYVGNLLQAIEQAMTCPADYHGRAYNVTDPRLVTKQEFVFAIADAFDLPRPKRHVPLPIARAFAIGLESWYRLRKKQSAPLLSRARYKFLGLNLDFSSARAREELGYDPQTDFKDGMAETLESLRGEST